MILNDTKHDGKIYSRFQKECAEVCGERLGLFQSVRVNNKKTNTDCSGHKSITPKIRELSDQSIKLHIRGEHEERTERRSYS